MRLSSASDAERHAERLREDLGATLDQIADNLSPRRIAAGAVTAARERTPDWLGRYWGFAQSPAGLTVIGGVLGLGIAGLLGARHRGRRIRR